MFGKLGLYGGPDEPHKPSGLLYQRVSRTFGQPMHLGSDLDQKWPSHKGVGKGHYILNYCIKVNEGRLEDVNKKCDAFFGEVIPWGRVIEIRRIVKGTEFPCYSGTATLS